MSTGGMTHWADAKPVEMVPGVTRRMMTETADMMLVEVRALAGAHVPIHSHPHQQITYVISGQVDMTIDGKLYSCKAGDSCPIPGGAEHMADFPVDTMLVDCFSPPREEYR
jgi:unsaturated pyranuronate lyase